MYCVTLWVCRKAAQRFSFSLLSNLEKRFEKKLNTKDFGIVRKCPGCGASINVNNTGKCEYCDTIFNLDDYDYILVSINVN